MAIDWAQVSRNLVSKAYRETLGREADQGGSDYWVGELMSGRITPDALSDKLRQIELGPLFYSLQDNDYAAFLRGANLQESEMESALAAARDRRNRNIMQRDPYYDLQRKQALENSAYSHEDRGLFRSGMRLQDQAERTKMIDYTQAQERQNIADTAADAESDITRQIAALRRQKLEQETAARTRLTQRDAQTALSTIGV